MFDKLTALGWGVVTFAVTIGIGVAVLEKFSGAVANCPAFVRDSSRTTVYNVTSQKCDSGIYCTTVGGGTAQLNTSYTSGVPTCYNSSANYTSGAGVANVFNDRLATSTGTVNVNYMNTTLGTNGLAGWAPAIIAFAVGMLFLGAFLIGGQKKQY